MTDIEQKALAQAVAAAGRRMQDYAIMAEENVLRQSIEAHARAIEQHEAFRQEVSDAVEAATKTAVWAEVERLLSPFIIAKPVDPLVEVISEVRTSPLLRTDDEMADQFRSLMKARGYEWRKIEGEG